MTIPTRMLARSVSEPHRSSSQLELLFDLTFVVAIASVTPQFAHGISEGHGLEELGPFLQVFFAIWWAWMNFTWFGSSFDTDDPTSRLLTLVQMGGVLVLSAGVPQAFAHGDYTFVSVGYLIMRSGLAVQWLRAAAANPIFRATSLRYAFGIAVLQAAWLLRLVLPVGETATLGVTTFIVLAVAEMLVSWWAQRTGETTWHPHHIADRYGLFVIILLGESVLASSTGVATAITTSGTTVSLVVVAASGLALLFALWWLYFLEPAGYGLEKNRARSYIWGYGHFIIFAALAALAAGLEAAIGENAHHAAALGVGYGVAVPVSVFLVLVWLAHAHISKGSKPATRGVLILPAAGAVLGSPQLAVMTGVPAVTVIATICAALVAASLLLVRRSERSRVSAS